MFKSVKAVALSAVVMLSACGGGGGDESKDLFSLWTRDGDGMKLELSGGAFGTEGLINFYTQDGTRCMCDLAIIGSQGEGSIAVTGCISIPYSPSKNPQCTALNGTGSYTKNNATLTITRNGQTGTFH